MYILSKLFIKHINISYFYNSKSSLSSNLLCSFSKEFLVQVGTWVLFDDDDSLWKFLIYNNFLVMFQHICSLLFLLNFAICNISVSQFELLFDLQFMRIFPSFRFTVGWYNTYVPSTLIVKKSWITASYI